MNESIETIRLVSEISEVKGDYKGENRYLGPMFDIHDNEVVRIGRPEQQEDNEKKDEQVVDPEPRDVQRQGIQREHFQELLPQQLTARQRAPLSSIRTTAFWCFFYALFRTIQDNNDVFGTIQDNSGQSLFKPIGL